MHGYFLEAETSGDTWDQEKETWYLYILMEYAEKGDLMQLIDRHRKNQEFIKEE